MVRLACPQRAAPAGRGGRDIGVVARSVLVSVAGCRSDSIVWKLSNTLLYFPPKGGRRKGRRRKGGRRAGGFETDDVGCRRVCLVITLVGGNR